MHDRGCYGCELAEAKKNVPTAHRIGLHASYGTSNCPWLRTMLADPATPQGILAQAARRPSLHMPLIRNPGLPLFLMDAAFVHSLGIGLGRWCWDRIWADDEGEEEFVSLTPRLCQILHVAPDEPHEPRIMALAAGGPANLWPVLDLIHTVLGERAVVADYLGFYDGSEVLVPRRPRKERGFVWS